jgi:uncharacterized protein
MSLTLLDWRRRVAELYREVRRTADAEQAHAAWRAGRDELLRTHPDSPLLPEARQQFGGLAVAPYDRALRFECEVVTDVPEETREVATGTDGVLAMRRFGLVELATIGTLDVWWLGTYGGGVFVPVKDGLAGRKTYGAGRYLIDTVKGADLGGELTADGEGTLVVDLNFAYNPSCAYDPAWACPLAGPGNTLAADLYAGELTMRSPA